MTLACCCVASAGSRTVSTPGRHRRWAGSKADAAEALAGLVSQSLLTVEEDPGTGVVRYRMLETVREFGGRALAAAGEEAAVREAMLRWAEAFCMDVSRRLAAAAGSEVFEAMHREQDTLVAVLRTAERAGRADAAVTIFAALAYYWFMQGAQEEMTGFTPAILALTRGYRPDAAHRDSAVTGYALMAVNELVGDARDALRARARLRALAAGPGTVRDRRITALSSLLLAAPGVPRMIRLLAAQRRSTDPGAAALGELMTAQLDENAGRLAHALTRTRRAYELGSQAGDVWLAASAAQALANLESQRSRPQPALDWAGRARDGLRLMHAGADTHRHLDWLTAVNRLATRPAQARAVFDRLIGQEAGPGIGVEDWGSFGLAGLAELALRQGREAEGLRLYRRAVDGLRHGGGRFEPWFGIAGAACLCAHARAADGTGRIDPELAVFADLLARRLRSRLLVARRLRGTFADMPVAGTTVAGLAAWLVQRGRDGRPEAGRPAAERCAASRLGLALTVLPEALGGRQDLPALNRQRLLGEARDVYGVDLLEAARVRAVTLARTPQAAFARACTLVTGPDARLAFALP